MLEHDAWGAHRWRGLPQPTPSESFKKVASAWTEIDTAIVNIGNYPSSPDYAIQIPISRLARCRNVIAVCSAALQPKALVGALRTGLITHVIAAESVARQALDLS